MARSAAFVGRQAELGRARALLEQAASGRSGGLLVVGAPGVGKTRLLAEIAATARAEGFFVAGAACLPLTTPLPYDPALTLLRDLRRAGATGIRVPGTGRGDATLFAAVVSAIERAADRAPLQLALDDLHWSDSATLELVHYCAARLADLPIAWLLAARPAGILAPLLHHLGRLESFERVDLDVFSEADVGELLAAALSAEEVGPDLVRSVYERSGGNAFFCQELVRAHASSPPHERLPASVAASVAMRVRELTPPAVSVLEWAAILPEPFSTAELAKVARVDDLDTPRAQLVEAAFLASDSDRGYRFTHSIVRDAVYQGIPLGEQTRRHGVVAEALPAMPPERRAPQLVAAARHSEAAAAYLELASEALQRAGGGDASELYARAESLALEAADGSLQLRAAAGRVLALLRQGERDEADERAGRLLAELRHSGDDSLRLVFLSRLATALWDDASDLEAAKAVLQETEPLLAGAEGAELAEAALAQARILDRAGSPAEALVHAQRALAAARQAGDKLLELWAANRLGLIVGETQTAAAGIALLTEVATQAEEAGFAAEAGLARLNLSYLADVSGDPETMARHARAGLALPDLPPNLHALLQSNLGVALMELGDLDGALAHQLAAGATAARVSPGAEQRASLPLCHVLIRRGELDQAAKLIEQADSQAGSFEHYRWLEARAMLLEEQGDLSHALEAYEQGHTAGDYPIVTWFLAGAARTASNTGQLAAAEHALSRLAATALRWPAATWLLEASHGYLAAATGDVPAAINRFRAAEQLCTDALDRAHYRLETARLARDRDAILGVIAELDTMGASRAADRARATARALGMRPGRPRRPTGPLSARERKVALLIASGHTNAEIAAHLYLSQRTVERHVGAILAKLGYRSRVQLAAEVAAGRLPGTNENDAR
jgi:DNA-binding CsgD family transcriptional regulator